VIARRRRVLSSLASTPVLIGALVGGVSDAQTAPTGIVNARMETRSAAAGLEAAARTVLASKTPVWIAYRVPMARRPAATMSTTGTCCGQCRLEPPAELTVLARADMGAVVGLRAMAVDCDVDATGATVIWLNEVKPDDSVGWLASLVAQSSSASRLAPLAASALSAIGQHDARTAVPTLVKMARDAASRPVQRQAIFWLGRSNDPAAMKFFEEVLLK
jgi:hypothetical protein